MMIKPDRNYFFFINIFSILTLLLFWGIVVLRMWGGGFTGGDEGATAIASERSGSLLYASYELASSQGRFYQIFAYTLAQVPYIVSDLRWTNVFRILSTTAPISCFYYLIHQHFGFRYGLSILCILLLIMDTVGNGAGVGYNPFNALPMWFNLSLCFFFLSLDAYIWAVKNGTTTWISYGLFFVFMLFYEISLAYALLYPLIYFIFKKNKLQKFDYRIYLKEFCATNIGLFFFLGIYLLAYVAFRHSYPSNYVGTSGLSWGGLRSFLSTVGIFSINGAYVRDIVVIPKTISAQSTYIVFGLITILMINLREINRQSKSTISSSPHFYVIFFTVIVSI